MTTREPVVAAPIVIVGGGQAGATAAAQLRAFGYSGPVLIIGDEHYAPYERPPLSKTMLSNAGAVSDLRIHADDFYAEQKIDLRLGRVAIKLDTTQHTLSFDDGSTTAYSQCLIATGGSPRLIPGLDPAMPRVHYLRSAADALRLQGALQQQRSVLIVGGGFLGLELASTARTRGLRVTVLEGAPRLLSRVVPAEFSEWLLERVRAAGVDVRLGANCESFEVTDEGVTARLADGDAVHGEMIVVAVGMIPSTALAQASGIASNDRNGGIRVDAHCRTSALDVYAAGDCASQYHPHLLEEARLESWQNANEQARVAAAAMAGVDTGPLIAPWFWTDQFGCNLQMLGMPSADLTYFRRAAVSTDDDAPKFLLLGATEVGVLKHAIAVNAGGDLAQLRSLINGRRPCDPIRMCDTSQPLRQSVRSAMAGNVPKPASLS